MCVENRRTMWGGSRSDETRRAPRDPSSGIETKKASFAIKKKNEMTNSPAFFTLLSSSMSSSSTTCLPAVSTTTVSYPSAAAFSTASLAISAGSASVPIEKTSTPIDVPRISSCSIAAGRYTSAAQRRT